MTIERVAGLDLSLTSTGIALQEPGGIPQVNLVTSKGRRDDPFYQRVMRIEAIVEQILEVIPPRTYVLVEGPSYGSAGASSSLWDRAGLWHRVVAALIARKHPVAVAAPTTVKKWATGSGNADKAAVASAITRLLPPEVELVTSDGADSLVMAKMAAHHLGWESFSKARTACLDAVWWPEEVLGERAA